MVIKNNNFNNFYEKLLFLYSNKDLDPKFEETFNYLQFFIDENFNNIDKEVLKHKINVFNYMIEHTDVLNNDVLEPISENYYRPSIEVQISLKYLDIKL